MISLKSVLKKILNKNKDRIRWYARDQRKHSIEYWRRIIFFSIFHVMWYIGFVAYSLVFIHYLLFEKYPVQHFMISFDTIIFFCVYMIVFVRAIPYNIKMYVGTFLLYFLGAGMLVLSGPSGDNETWFIGFITLASIFSGWRYSLFGAFLILITKIVLKSIHHVTGLLEVFQYTRFSYWTVVCLNSFLMSVVIIIAISILLKKLEESFSHMEKSKTAIIVGLAKLTEYKDKYTGDHLERIGKYALIIANKLAERDEYASKITIDYKNNLELSAILHDIGKVGIPDNILLKNGRLTAEEFEVIKKHSIYGGDVLARISKSVEDKDFYRIAQYIAYFHHEKWDGSGYPKGLQGDEIPLAARITALADVYDALTSKRSYKESFSHETAKEIIVSERGKHFDPIIVDIFLELEDKFIDINKRFKA